MSQGLKIVRPRRGFKLVGTLFAIGALMLQPLVPLNIPNVLALDGPAVSPTAHTIYGGGQI